MRTHQAVRLYKYRTLEFQLWPFSAFLKMLVAWYWTNLLAPSYSKCVFQASRRHYPGTYCIRNAESQLCPKLLNRNLHFTKFSRWFNYTEKFEKHGFSKHGRSHLVLCHRDVSLLERTLVVHLSAKPSSHCIQCWPMRKIHENFLVKWTSVECDMIPHPSSQ